MKIIIKLLRNRRQWWRWRRRWRRRRQRRHNQEPSKCLRPHYFTRCVRISYCRRRTCVIAFAFCSTRSVLRFTRAHERVLKQFALHPSQSRSQADNNKQRKMYSVSVHTRINDTNSHCLIGHAVSTYVYHLFYHSHNSPSFFFFFFSLFNAYIVSITYRCSPRYQSICTLALAILIFEAILFFVSVGVFIFIAITKRATVLRCWNRQLRKRSWLGFWYVFWLDMWSFLLVVLGRSWTRARSLNVSQSLIISFSFSVCVDFILTASSLAFCC